MLLMVREIHVENQDVLLLPDLNSSNDQDQNLPLFQLYSTLYTNREVHQVKPKCLEYINAISNCPLDDPETVIGDTPKIIWKSLEYYPTLFKSEPDCETGKPLTSLYQ